MLSKVTSGESWPENLPLQPRQYLAASRLGVWQELQNFVMPFFDFRVVVHASSSRAALIIGQKARGPCGNAGFE